MILTAINGMWFVPVNEIETIDEHKYKISGSEKNDRFDELLNVLQISHKKSIKNKNAVDENIRNLKTQNSSNEVTGISASEIIWHKMAIIDDTSGKIGVEMILFLNFNPRILTASEFKISFVGEVNSITEKIKTIMWNNRLINKQIFKLLNDFFKLLQIKTWMHKIKIKIIPMTEVHDIDDKINKIGIIGSNIIAKK